MGTMYKLKAKAYRAGPVRPAFLFDIRNYLFKIVAYACSGG